MFLTCIYLYIHSYFFRQRFTNDFHQNAIQSFIGGPLLAIIAIGGGYYVYETMKGKYFICFFFFSFHVTLILYFRKKK